MNIIHRANAHDYDLLLYTKIADIENYMLYMTLIEIELMNCGIGKK